MRKLLQIPNLHRLSTITAAIILALTSHGASAGGYGYKTVHAFCKEANCADGKGPQASLLMDASGNLYGTTLEGGKYGFGLLFKLIPNADKSKYTEHILKNFCANAGCPDGSY